MKAKEAPEKIYIVNDDLNIKREWYKTKQVGFETTEYTRTDAFVDKACEWQRQHMKTLPELSNKDFTKHTLWKRDEIIDKFRQAMQE